MQFTGFPRVRLAHLPTPLEEMKNFSKALDGPRLFVKRDDSTGLGFGGNKIRKLEFLMGEALERKADTVITTGGVQSNHARQTAAAAKKLGMEAILLLRGGSLRRVRETCFSIVSSALRCVSSKPPTFWRWIKRRTSSAPNWKRRGIGPT